MASSAAAKNVAFRAVHIKISPRPASLFESRRILHKLKQFGEVDVFRLLPRNRDLEGTDQHTILTVFREEQSASNFLSQSPLEFEINKPDRRPAGVLGLSVLSKTKTSKTSSSKLQPSSPSTTTPSGAKGTSSDVRTFHVVASRSSFDHYAHIMRQPFYWDFKLSHDTFAEENLQRSVPIRALATLTSPQPEISQRIVNQKLHALSNRESLAALSKNT